jgi:hypothetical protein
VHDEGSLGQYFLAHNLIETGSHKTEVEGLVEPNKDANSLGTLNIVIYAIGTCIALSGSALD